MAAEEVNPNEEGHLERIAEASELLSRPPALSPHPTDSFWLHATASFDEKALKHTKIQSDPYDYVIIGAFLMLPQEHCLGIRFSVSCPFSNRPICDF